jgi:PHD/YefM family antitoxin component YafN of YafNO toxin-antitoxin module
MNVQKNIWTASKAKAELSALIDEANEQPQVIERYGKPAATVINWQLYEKHRDVIEGTLEPWLRDLEEINTREGEMEPVIRQDRPLPDVLY